MILEEQITKVAQVTSPGMLAKVKHLAVQATAQIDAHPVVAVAAGIGSSLVAVMQSAQEVIGTLIALVTSLAGLVLAVAGLRAKWKNRNKE